MRVCAVLSETGPAPAGAADVVRAPSLAAGVEQAMSTGCEWLWLVDAVTTPDPDALERMLAVLGDLGPLPEPLVLASKVVGPDGALDDDALPAPEMFEKEISVDACDRRLVQVRALRPGSVLVARRAVERFGGPRPGLRPPYDVLEWTARILRSWEDPGYLVTASVARRAATASHTAAPLADRLRGLLTGPGWTPTEKLWNAYTLVVRPDGGSHPLKGGAAAVRRA